MSEILPSFQFVGGALCLDFVNTVGSHTSSEPREKLCAYADLVRWMKEAALINHAQAQQLLADGQDDSGRSKEVLENAREFREILFRIFHGLCQETEAQPADLAALNEALRAFPIRLEVRSQGKNFLCQRSVAQSSGSWLLAPIAWSAVDLLVSEQVGRVRMCADPTCGWFFLDNTKNHSRRWCAMGDCGSKAKAKTYYQRKKRATNEKAKGSSAGRA
jgi:predicted RNA-binding Zn ribbon-like protein